MKTSIVFTQAGVRGAVFDMLASDANTSRIRQELRSEYMALHADSYTGDPADEKAYAAHCAAIDWRPFVACLSGPACEYKSGAARHVLENFPEETRKTADQNFLKTNKTFQHAWKAVHNLQVWLSRNCGGHTFGFDGKTHIADIARGDNWVPVAEFKTPKPTAQKTETARAKNANKKARAIAAASVPGADDGAVAVETVLRDAVAAQHAIIKAFELFPELAVDPAIEAARNNATAKLAKRQTNVTRARTKKSA